MYLADLIMDYKPLHELTSASMLLLIESVFTTQKLLHIPSVIVRPEFGTAYRTVLECWIILVDSERNAKLANSFIQTVLLFLDVS